MAVVGTDMLQKPQNNKNENLDKWTFNELINNYKWKNSGGKNVLNSLKRTMENSFYQPLLQNIGKMNIENSK